MTSWPLLWTPRPRRTITSWSLHCLADYPISPRWQIPFPHLLLYLPTKSLSTSWQSCLSPAILLPSSQVIHLELIVAFPHQSFTSLLFVESKDWSSSGIHVQFTPENTGWNSLVIIAIKEHKRRHFTSWENYKDAIFYHSLCAWASDFRSLRESLRYIIFIQIN